MFSLSTLTCRKKGERNEYAVKVGKLLRYRTQSHGLWPPTFRKSSKINLSKPNYKDARHLGFKNRSRKRNELNQNTKQVTGP